MLAALTLWKEIRRQVRTPHRLIIWLGLPIVLTTIIGVAFGGRSTSDQRIAVAIVDEDTGWIGRLLGVSLEAATHDLLETIMMERARAENRLRTTRELAGMIVIPEGATSAFLNGTPIEFIWTPNPRMVIYPAVAHQALQQILGMAGSTVQAFRRPLSLIRQAQSGERVSSQKIADAFQKRFETLSQSWFPPAVTLRVHRPQTSQQKFFGLFDIFRTVFPPLVLYSLFFVCQGLMRSLVRERKEGTLARILASPIPFTPYYLATQLAFVVFALLIFAVLLILGILAYRLVPAHPLLSMVAIVASVWCFLSFVGLVYGLARTERGAGAFAELFGTLLALIGGVFFPISPDSGFLFRLSQFSFLAWGAHALAYAIHNDPSFRASFSTNIARLLIAGTLFALFAAFTLRRKLVTGSGLVYA